MSDASSIVGNFLSVDELLTPQFLYPVCGVILCAVAVFLVGVGFKSSSEPKFQISGDGDGVPFLKKKKKQKGSVGQTIPPKKAPVSSPAQSKSLKGRRPDDFLDRDAPISAVQTSALTSRNFSEPVPVPADNWITPVSRKEKKARRRQEFPTEKDSPERVEAMEVETLLAVREPEPAVLEVVEPPPSPQERRAERRRQDEAELIRPIPEKVEEEVKPKKSKQKQKAVAESVPAKPAPAAVESVQKPAPASPGRDSGSKKKKKSVETTPTPGGFQVAEFELPAAVTASAPRKSPSPPSTDSSFELVDADAVREAFQEAEEEKQPSKTSGASRKKNKNKQQQPPARGGNDVSENAPIGKIAEPPPPPAPEPAMTASFASAASEPAEAVSEEWQDAKSTRKRRRPRRDD